MLDKKQTLLTAARYKENSNKIWLRLEKWVADDMTHAGYVMIASQFFFIKKGAWFPHSFIAIRILIDLTLLLFN